MGTIIDEIKTLLEIDLTEPIFDYQLLLYINNGISYLKNNKIPLTKIDATTPTDVWITLGLREGDEKIVFDWLHLYIMQRFDRTLTSMTTANWIASELENLIYQLKVIYDNEASV
jgi:hypothetical protein